MVLEGGRVESSGTPGEWRGAVEPAGRSDPAPRSGPA
jgi:hypothetical protein